MIPSYKTKDELESIRVRSNEFEMVVVQNGYYVSG
jgi:hypothetical protein